MAPLGFPTTMLYAFLSSPHMSYLPCPTHHPVFGRPSNIYEQYKSLCHESNADLCSDVTAGTF